MKTSIIIPNYNGIRLLAKNLPGVLAAGANEIIICDDGSTDESTDFINNNYPQIKLLTSAFSPRHFGFPGNCNRAVLESSGDIIILLNNDVIPEKNFLKPLIKHFSQKNVFAVGASEPDTSWATAKFQDGFFEHQPGKRSEKNHISMWASGGSSAFSRQKWMELGGFYEGFNPGYWEDIDISYRAWKRGWQVLWEPESIVFHKHESTFASIFTRKQIDFISRRNQFLFIWKNITSEKLIRQHQKSLIKNIFQDPGMIKSLLAAAIKIPEVIKLREIEKKEEKVSDEEIFEKFKNG